MGLFFGASILVRKWLAKMTKMAVLAKMAKMTQNGLIFENWRFLGRFKPFLLY